MARGSLSPAERYACQLLAAQTPLAEVAHETDLSIAQIQKRLRDNVLFKQEVERWQTKLFRNVAEKLTTRLEQLQEPALERMGALLHAESEPVQFNAAKNLLDRGPLAPKSASASDIGGAPGGATIHLDQQALTAIISGALNIGNRSIVAAFAALPNQQALPAGTILANATPVPEEEGREEEA